MSIFVIFDPPAYRTDADPLVTLRVWPSTGRLEPASCSFEHQSDGAYKALVQFDREELWKVNVRVAGQQGSGDIELEVPVTPPGYGRWDLLVYFTPFLMLGVLWIAVSIKKRRMIARGD